MKSLFSGVFGALKNGLNALKSDYRDIKDYYKENGLKKTISDVKTIRSLISGNHSSSGEKTGIFGKKRRTASQKAPFFYGKKQQKGNPVERFSGEAIVSCRFMC